MNSPPNLKECFYKFCCQSVWKDHHDYHTTERRIAKEHGTDICQIKLTPPAKKNTQIPILLYLRVQLAKKEKLSCVVPSSVVEVELRYIWIWVETALSNSWIEVFKVFNWNIWGLVPFYYFPSGWLGGCVIFKERYLSLKVEVGVELSLT